VALWNVAEQQRFGQLEGHKTEITSVAFSPDEKWAATAGGDQSAKLWDLETRKFLRSYRGQLLGLAAVDISPDGERLVAGTGEGTLKFWNIDTAQEVLTLKGHSYVPAQVFFLDSDTIVSASIADVIIWRAASVTEIETAAKRQTKAP
jgi:WD40 repeat protein